VILIDTSVWIGHLRSGDRALARLLNSGQASAHPFVIAELALGNLRQRQLIRDTLGDLPRTKVASDEEVLNFISRHMLFESGIGCVDTHLLAAARLTAGTTLWTRDKSLHAVADRLALAAIQPG
jgi:predicted nucleic acid-binding protein